LAVTSSQIAKATDLQQLYRARLKELFGAPNLARAQLGLLRMAYEGGVRLSCSYEGQILEIVAERAE
jgi:uncharacterized protein YciW